MLSFPQQPEQAAAARFHRFLDTRADQIEAQRVERLRQLVVFVQRDRAALFQRVRAIL
jgi:hypothetical protein